MDRKTLALLLTEALLIVVLIVVIAVDFNKPKVEKHVASHEAVTEHEAEAAAEPAEEAVAHEEKAETEEAPAEEAAEAEEAKEEAPAEEVAEVKEEKAEAPAAAAAPAAATGEVADVIAMDNPAYEKHTKGIVEFTHKKHNEEYKIGCGDCHHNDKGEPLTELKMGDPVQDCIACHSKPGKAPKPGKGEKLTDAQKREYHMNALHDNCIGCHKDYNKEKGTKDAPATCGKCHPKTKK